MEDRRIFQRFSVHFPIKFLDLKNGREGVAKTQDISAKGMGIYSNTPLQAATPLEIWLDIPDKGEPFYTRGEVVWAKSSGESEHRAGINLDKADLVGLSRILRPR